MVKVSIIVPIYNAAPYLERCVKSLLKQSFKDIEILLIDNNSKDNVYEIAQKFASRYALVKVFNCKKQGIAAVRNFAIEKAKGEFILSVDGDDYIDCDVVKKLVDYAESNAGPYGELLFIPGKFRFGGKKLDTISKGLEAISMMEEGKFGKSGARIVVEEFLTGPEVSVLAFTDGKTVKPMVSSMDHKRAMDNDEGDVYAGDHLGNSLLGFHGLEYILFENGSPKPAASISDKELVYAIAVAGDLRNHCYQLEVSWMGDEAPVAHVQKVEELEYNTTVNGSNNSYGDNMVNAGTPGSTYASTINALMSIIDGCNTIVDEVGTSKIGKPYHGEDVHYIESPYSQKSIQDFYHTYLFYFLFHILQQYI